MDKKEKNPFMPHGYLEPFNSLNRLNNSVNALSSDIFIEFTEENRCDLIVPEDLSKDKYFFYLNSLAYNDATPRGDLAREIFNRWILSLSNFLKLLLQANSEERLAHRDWEKEHWDFWKSRETIVLGGGLTMGYLGKKIVSNIAPYLIEINKNVIIPRWRYELPIIGAVLNVPGVVNGWILGIDFGHSSIKSQIFRVVNGWVVSSRDLLVSKVERNFLMMDNNFSCDKKEFSTFFYTSLHSICRKAIKLEKISGLGISIANYIQNGFVVNRGLYGNLDGHMTNKIKNIMDLYSINRKNFSIQHDGTAAANCYFYSRKPAVIIFGSAIGGGFPYEEPPLKWSEFSYTKL